MPCLPAQNPQELRRVDSLLARHFSRLARDRFPSEDRKGPPRVRDANRVPRQRGKISEAPAFSARAKAASGSGTIKTIRTVPPPTNSGPELTFSGDSPLTQNTAPLTESFATTARQSDLPGDGSRPLRMRLCRIRQLAHRFELTAMAQSNRSLEGAKLNLKLWNLPTRSDRGYC